MAENYQSTNQWIANCDDESGDAKDLDYRVWWGNNGKLTVTRNNLIEIEYTMRAWNSKDGWFEETSTQTLEQPTDRHTFNLVAHAQAFGAGDLNRYWTRRYIIEGILKIRYGTPPGEIEDIYTTTVNGCFRQKDPHYFPKYPCTPPDVACEEE